MSLPRSRSDAEEEGELEPAKELIQPIAEKLMAKYKAKEEETPLLFFVAGEVRPDYTLGLCYVALHLSSIIILWLGALYLDSTWYTQHKRGPSVTQNSTGWMGGSRGCQQTRSTPTHCLQISLPSPPRVFPCSGGSAEFS